MSLQFNPFTGTFDVTTKGDTGAVAAAGDGSAAAPGITFASDTNTGIYRPGADQLALSTNGTGRLFIDANGQVGLNNAPLSTYGLTLGPTSGQTISLLGLRSSSDTGNSRIDFGDPTASDVARIQYEHAVDSMVFRVNAGERLRITSTGLVGVGTSSPSALLTVGAAYGGTPNSESRTVIQSAGNSYLTIGAGSSNQAGLLFADTAANNAGGILYTHSSDSLDFIVAGNGRLRIDSSGRVGIGTQSPGYLVTAVTSADGVDGVSVESPSLNGVIRLRADGTNGNAIRVGGAGAQGNTLRFLVGSDAERMRIDSSGRLGIGTASPNTSIIQTNQSTATIAAGINLYNSSGVSGGIVALAAAGSGGGSDALYLQGSSNIQIVTGATERARIDSSGRLLVGTSTSRAGAITGSVAAVYETRSGGSNGDSTQVVMATNFNDTRSSTLSFVKSRSTTLSGFALVANNDRLGDVDFCGTDGTNVVSGARIQAFVDGTPGADDMPGRLVFSTTPDSGSSPVERLRITSDAYVRLASGTGGIQFNGDTAAANALDDYEEGTWTPVYTPTAGSFTTMTMNVQSARYVKIGQLVTVQAYIVTSNVDVTGASGSVNITGLPFTSYSAQPLRRSGAIGFSTAFATAPQFWGITENSTTINLYEARVDALDVADLSTGAGSLNIIWLEASYYAA